MVNCAHPTHFEDALARGEAWTGCNLFALRTPIAERALAAWSERGPIEVPEAPDSAHRRALRS